MTTCECCKERTAAVYMDGLNFCPQCCESWCWTLSSSLNKERWLKEQFTPYYASLPPARDPNELIRERAQKVSEHYTDAAQLSQWREAKS